MYKLIKRFYSAVAATLIASSLSFTVHAAEFESGRLRGPGVGNVWVMNNSEVGNSVIIYNRFSDGSLRQVGRKRTRGLGGNNEVAVDPLGSQNSLILSNDGNFMFAVNAGSNEITSFRVSENGRLRFSSKVPSGGESPVSLAMDGDDRLLVLNSRGTGSIAVFDVDSRARLSMVPGSIFNLGLSADNVADMNVAPGQIVLDSLNRRVLVTNGLLGTVTSYNLDNNGLIFDEEATVRLAADLPFTLALTRFGHVLVAQATVFDGGFQFNQGALSSIDLDPSFSLSPEIVSDSISNGQSATCWVVTDGNRFAFTTSTFSDTISSYSFNRDGELRLLDAQAAFTNDGPIDLGLTDDGEFLYVLNAGDGETTPQGPNDLSPNNPGGNISVYRVNTETGELSSIGSFGNLPAAGSIQGIAIR